MLLRLDPRERAGGVFSYCLAGHVIATDTEIPALRPFAAGSPGRRGWPAVVRPSGAQTQVRRVRGWVAGHDSAVSLSRSGDSYLLAVDELPPVAVDRAGCRVLPVETGPGDPAGRLVEVVLGPGLMLSLALGGTFALHAAAAARGARTVVLLGESGAGKSTTGRALGAVPGFARVADDVLPVAAGCGGLVALPHYPQLKVSAAEQYPAAAAERVAIAAIVVLAPDATGRSGVALEPLGERDAFLALARHTVAARLFDAALLERHAAFCATVAETTPVLRLAFPRRLDALPETTTRLAALLGE